MIPLASLPLIFVLFRLLFGVAFDALKHRDVSQIDRMPKRCVTVVASLAFSIRESPKIDRMLNIDCPGNSQRPG